MAGTIIQHPRTRAALQPSFSVARGTSCLGRLGIMIKTSLDSKLSILVLPMIPGVLSCAKIFSKKVLQF